MENVPYFDRVWTYIHSTIQYKWFDSSGHSQMLSQNRDAEEWEINKFEREVTMNGGVWYFYSWYTLVIVDTNSKTRCKWSANIEFTKFQSYVTLNPFNQLPNDVED